MANGVQLATAYISLNVRTDDIKKQVEGALRGAGGSGRQVGRTIGSDLVSGMRDRINTGTAAGFFAPIGVAGVRWAGTAGRAIGGALRTAIMSAATAGIGAAIFGAGAALSAGLNRLKVLQQAEVQLSLRLNPAEIKKVKTAVEDAVKDTQVSLDVAMRAAPRLVNAGLSPEEINQYTKAVANLSAATGGIADFERLDLILSQVRSKTKLTAEEMLQLVEAGVDVRGMLKETFGFDDKTLQKNLEKGKITIDDILKAADKVYGKNGGLSKMMGQTFDGAIGNLKASVASLGANFISAVLGKDSDQDPLKDYAAGISRITEGLDGMSKWVDENRDEIHTVFRTIGNVAGWVGDKLVKLPGYFEGFKRTAGSVADWFSRTWDDASDAVGRVGDKVKSTFDSVKDKITAIPGQVKSSMTKLWEDLKTGLNNTVDTVTQYVKDKFLSIFGPDSAIGKLLSAIGIGTATANAAASAPGGAAPFNPGPMKPGADSSGTSASGGVIRRGGMGRGTGRGYPIPGDSAGDFVGDVFGRGTGMGSSAFNPGPMKSGSSGDSRGPKFSSNSSSISSRIGPQDIGMGTPGAFGASPIYTPNINVNYGAKGLPDWIYPFADHFGLEVSTYSGGGTLHEAGYAFDFRPKGVDVYSPEGQQRMRAASEYIKSNLAEQTLQLIFMDTDGKKFGVAGGTAVGPGTDSPGYYADNWAGHVDHIHWATDVPIQQNYSVGGKVLGPGNGTSDSIPAMLSNGEHVLTAADVKKMGGQGGVYAFRQMLQAGIIPGFAPGGAVDPNIVIDTQNQLADLVNQQAVAKAKWDEVMANSDSTENDKAAATRELTRSQRLLDQMRQDAPIIMAGGTPPDRGPQNRVFDATDQLDAQNRALQDLMAQEDVPDSQMIAAQYGVAQARRERDQAIGELQGTGPGTDYGQQFIRSLGFIPAAAGNTGVAGTSSLANFIGMGNDVVSGLIDSGTNLAQQAVSAAITGAALSGSFGAAAPAAPLAQMAASYGIQLLGNQAKRLSAFGFQLAGIGADALMEQISPFGMPRWLGYDYGNFMPQVGIQQAALSTLEQMGGDAIKKYFAGQGAAPVVPADPTAGVNMTPSGPSAAVTAPPPPPTPATPGNIMDYNDPGFYNRPMILDFPNNPTGAGGGGGGGSWAKGGHVGIYDNGGVLNPGELAFNASRTPESILTKQQWNAMAANASTRPRENAPLVQNLYAQDMSEAIRKLEQVKRRDMMQYAGRS